MKKRVNWLLIPAVALALGACKKKEEVKAPEAPPAVAEAPPQAPARTGCRHAKVPGLSAEERAAKLGFVQASAAGHGGRARFSQRHENRRPREGVEALEARAEPNGRWIGMATRR